MVASMISFGALIAFTFVNLSVIKHFYIDRKAPLIIQNYHLPDYAFYWCYPNIMVMDKPLIAKPLKWVYGG